MANFTCAECRYPFSARRNANGGINYTVGEGTMTQGGPLPPDFSTMCRYPGTSIPKMPFVCPGIHTTVRNAEKIGIF